MNLASERAAKGRRITQSDLDRIVVAFGGRSEIADIYPQSPLQRGILFHAYSAPASAVYAIAAEWRIHGFFDPEILKTAWSLLVERHAVLRTAFAGHLSSLPLQVVRRN